MCPTRKKKTSSIVVIKRDGRKEGFDFSKIENVVSLASQGLDKIDLNEFWSKFELVLKNEITTKEIQQNLINTAINLIYKNGEIRKEYSILANRFRLMDFWKEVKLQREREYSGSDFNKYGMFENSLDWVEHIRKYAEKGIYDERFLKISKTTLAHLYAFAKELNKQKGFHYLWNNFIYQSEKFINSYLIKQNGKFVETFDEAHLLLSVLAFFPDYKKNKDSFIRNVKRFYEHLTSYHIIPATPQLLNLRRGYGNLSSCNILDVKDNLETIYHSLTQCALISKNAGGIGVYAGRLRGSGSYLMGNPNLSNDVRLWFKLYEDTAIAVNQGGNRKGAITVALPLWHKDVIGFINSRNPLGEKRLKLFDIYPQITVPRLFFKKVKNKEYWYLVDHHEINLVDETINLIDTYGEEFEKNYEKVEKLIEEGKLKNYKKIKATELLTQIFDGVISSGFPYIFFDENANEYSPFKEKIHCGNLCVSPDTKILTKEYGYIEIEKVAGEILNVWNGEEWSKSAIFKTGENYDNWYEIEFTNGEKIVATNYHRWYVKENVGKPYKSKTTVKRTFELKKGDVLEKWDLPLIRGKKELEYAYENGLFSAEGTSYNNSDCIYLYDKKKGLIDELGGYYRKYTSPKLDRIEIYFKKGILKDKFFVPDSSFTIDSRIRWLEGLFDGDGTVVKNNNTYTLQLCSTNIEFLKDVKRMLETLGIHSKIVDGYKAGFYKMPDGKGGHNDYFCKEMKRLLISAYELNKLIELGFSPKRLDLSGMKIPNREAGRYVKVKSIKKLEGFVSDSYCFYEPKLNRGVLNGVLTGNCMESFSPFNNTNREGRRPNEGTPEDEIGYAHSCNLFSLNLPKLYEDGILFNNEKLRDLLKLVVRYMDNTIEISNPPVEEVEKHNREYRTIGIGFIGFADLLVKLTQDTGKLHTYYFTKKSCGDEAKREELKKRLEDVVKKVFGSVSFYTMLASCELAKERGRAPKFKQTKWAEGIILGRYNIEDYETLREVFPSISDSEFEELKYLLSRYGIRNTMLMTCPPNTSTSLYAGSSASILPVYNIISAETQKKNIYITFPRYVENRLFYDVYVEADDKDMYDVAEFVSMVQKYIDSGISFEYIINREKLKGKELAKFLAKFFFLCEKLGVKTLYYARTRTSDNSSSSCSSCAN